jgi:hypothetical protein
MPSARAPSAKRGATHASLRALAGLVAVLLGLSSLGQFAHFLLVPHAICPEHGELVELTDAEEHAVHDGVAARSKADGGSVTAAASELSEDHDHCQVLSRGQREQLTPPPALQGLPHAASHEAPSSVDTGAAPRPLAALTLAPKTSPPRALAC